MRTGRLMRSIRQTYRKQTTSVSPASPRLKGRTSTSYDPGRWHPCRCALRSLCPLVPCRNAERAQQHARTDYEAAPAKFFTLRYGDRTVKVRIRLGRFVRVRLARDSHATYIRGHTQLPPASHPIGDDVSLYCFGSDISALLIVGDFDVDTADEDVIEAASRRVDGLFGFDDLFPARVSSTNRVSLGEWVLDWDEAIAVDGHDNRYTVPYKSTSSASISSGGGGGSTTLGLRYVGWSDDTDPLVTADLDASMAEVNGVASNTVTIPTRSTNGYLFYALPEAAGAPSMIIVSNMFLPPTFTQQAGTVQDSEGNTYNVFVSDNLLSGNALLN